MQRSLYIDPAKCTGCLQCEMACSYENEGVFQSGEVQKSRSLRFMMKGVSCRIPVRSAMKPGVCMRALSRPITLNKVTGAVEVSDSVCVGCKVCTIACPFGTVNYNQDTGKVVKCDLCGGDPKCATACPTEAITYVDANATGLEKMRAWAGKTDNAAAAAH